MSQEVTLEKIRTLLKEFRTAMMITEGQDKRMHARPMGLQGKASEFDGTLYFFTGRESEKMKEIGSMRPASLTLQSDSANTYLHMEGTAEQIDDRAKMKEMYSPLIKTWFPKGLDDPSLTLIRFDADQVSYWDTPGGMLQVFAAFAKAVATGQPGKGGEMGELKL